MRLALISIASILVLFGLVIGGFFAYRKYQEDKRQRECVINIGRNGKFVVDGKYMDKKAIESHFRKRAGTVKYNEGFVKGTELERAINLPYGQVEGLYVRIPIQPFPLRISVNPEADFEDLHQLIDLIMIANMFNQFNLEIPGEHGMSIKLNLPVDYNSRILPDEPYPTVKDTGYIDLREIRVKLLWYSPNGLPRYVKPDGKLILKVKRKVFGQPGKPDWSEFEKYIRQKRKENYTNTPGKTRKSSAVLDARKYVPMKDVLRALRAIDRVGYEKIRIAAPEIPY